MTAPFQPGDRVRVSPHWLGTTDAPRKAATYYVRSCTPNPHHAAHDSPNDWFVALVGQPGFKPHRGEHTGHYNADYFDLVKRDPGRQLAA